MIVDKILLGLAALFAMGVIVFFFVFSFAVVWVAPLFPGTWIWRQRQDIFIESGNPEGAAIVFIAALGSFFACVYYFLIGAELLIRFLVSA